MAQRSSALAGLSRRALAPYLNAPRRGGGGGPVKLRGPITQPLPEQDELLWDDGSANPEPCLDEFPLLTTGQAVTGLAAGMSIFLALGAYVRLHNKPAKQPFAPREFPYDNLSVELGGEQKGLLGKMSDKLSNVFSS